MKTRLALTALALALLGSNAAQAHQSTAASELSAVSMLPVAVSVAAPSIVLSAGMVLTVVAIESVAKGTVWVLQRASDGARISVQFSGEVVAGAAMSAGVAISVGLIGSGYVLSAAGKAIAFIPNEIGASLLYNERVSK